MHTMSTRTLSALAYRGEDYDPADPVAPICSWRCPNSSTPRR
jgi:hypothetical protein